MAWKLTDWLLNQFPGNAEYYSIAYHHVLRDSVRHLLFQNMWRFLCWYYYFVDYSSNAAFFCFAIEANFLFKLFFVVVVNRIGKLLHPKGHYVLMCICLFIFFWCAQTIRWWTLNVPSFYVMNWISYISTTKKIPRDDLLPADF